MRPLEGVKVLDLSRLLPGGYATLLLADLGADVVKVEEPGRGDYIRWSPPMVGEQSAAHVALNRNKRSLTLNLKADAGRDLLIRLAEAYDVLVESFRPGVMERLGVGWNALKDRCPQLVYCAISGYGQQGPRSRVAGHDLNYVGYAGALSITGHQDSPPAIPGVQVGDLGGGMAAVIAILAALHRRSVTGRGGFCDVSMTDGVLSWMSIHAAAFFASNVIPRREQMPLNGGWPCYRVYPAADGHVTLAALEPQFWSVLCEALARPDLLGDAYATGDRRAEVVAELSGIFATRTRAEWLALLRDRDVCVGPVNDIAEAVDDPHVEARAMVVNEEIPGAGLRRHIGNPIRIDGPPDVLVRRPPPALGEHTLEILEETGVDPTTLEAMRAAGVV